MVTAPETINQVPAIATRGDHLRYVRFGRVGREQRLDQVRDFFMHRHEFAAEFALGVTETPKLYYSAINFEAGLHHSRILPQLENSVPKMDHNRTFERG